MQAVTSAKLYALHDVAPVSGNYLCVPCGYIQYFEAGARFTECLACFAGTSFGPTGFQNETDEFWRLV